MTPSSPPPTDWTREVGDGTTFRVAVVEDFGDVRDLLEKNLQAEGFDVRGYADAEALLSDLQARRFATEPLPDLVIVDLSLEKGKMQGIELIRELADRDLPLDMIAISGHQSTEMLAQAIQSGASEFLTKPFDREHLIRSSRRVALIGRSRKATKGSGRSESSSHAGERKRPVFLSFASADKVTATAVKRLLEARGIGVWYSHHLLEPGDAFLERIQDGLRQSRVFVAVLSDDYVDSIYCRGEASQFLDRMHLDPSSPLLFCPAVHRLTERGRASELFGRVSNQYQVAQLDGSHFIDGLTTVLLRIDSHLSFSVQDDRRRAGSVPARARRNDQPRG